MKKFLLGIVLALAVSGCISKSLEWSQGDRDNLISSCVEKGKTPGLDEAKLKNYCACYQKNLEKKYPMMADLQKAGPKDVAKSAEECLPLMLQ